MNANLLSVIKTLVGEQGEAVLADAKRVRGYLSDFAGGEGRAGKNAFVKCLEYGFYRELKNAPTDRLSLKGRLARKLRDEEGLDVTLSGEALDLLEAVVAGDTAAQLPQTPPADEWVTVAERREMTSVEAAQAAPDPADGGSFADSLENAPAAETAGPANPAADPEEKWRGRLLKLNERLENTKRGLAAVVVIGIGVLAGSIGIGINKYENISDRLYEVQSSYSELQSSYSTALKNLRINISSMSAGNSTQNNQWITSPGERLNASEIRYLKPRIEYSAWGGGEVKLDTKIISPGGRLLTGSSSPAGYTYSTTINISPGSSLMLDLLGYGNADQSSYYPGVWTVEIWYEGIRIYSAGVTLN
jgi:hypothetical protein